MQSDKPQLRKPKGFDAATAAASKKYSYVVLPAVVALLCLAAVYQATKPVAPQPAKGNNGARIATTTISSGSGAPVASKTTTTLRSSATKAVASSSTPPLQTRTVPRKLFIDLGANCGNSYWSMKKSLNPGSEETLTGPGWETILWECNPQMIDWFLTDLVAQEPNVTLIPHAASTSNGQLTFFLTSGQESATSKDEMPNPTCDPSSPYNPSGASTLYGTALRAGRNITVNTVDFLAWHQALNLQEGDTVHIKIDIEGAEVDILEVFLADPTNQMCYWHKFWNEYHKNIFPEGSPDYLVHEAFENSFPSRFEAKCGRPLPANEWS